MAWVQKYQILDRDRHNILWITKIYKQDYVGSVITLIAAGPDPMVFEHNNESDDPHDPIKDQKVVLTVWSYSMFMLEDLYSTEEMQYKVNIYQSVNLYFSGFIDPGDCEEDYGPVPYMTKIHVIDGLKVLSDIRYEQSEGVPYNGHKLESQILLDILGKIGFTTFTEYINIYEDSMAYNTASSPMDQLKINSDVFTAKEMYCDEALKEILKKYGACIRQQGGVFQIYRPKELIGATVYGRTFTDSITKSPTSFVSLQYIHRPAHSSALLQVRGSKKINQRPAKKVTIIHDLGNKKSWLDNSTFKGETFDGTDFIGWTRGEDYGYAKPIGDYVGGENEGIAIIDTEISPVFNIFQEIGDAAVSSAGDVIVVEFDYSYFNPTAALISSVDITMEVKQGSYYLSEINSIICEWTLTPTFLKITQNVPVGWTGWQSWKRQVVGLSASGKIKTTLFPTEWGSDCYACYNEINFYISSSQITRLKISNAIRNTGHRQSPSTMSRLWRQDIVEISDITKKEYVKTNAINGQDLKYDVLLGDVTGVNIDNIVEQFAGALILASDNSPTAVWNTRGGSESKPLLEIIGDEIAEHYSRPKQFLDFAIMETAKATSAFNTIGNIQDSINIYNSHYRAFIMNRGTFHVKYRNWKVDLLERGEGNAST